MFKLKWFKDCKSIEGVKKTYRDLAQKYHPDVSGKNTAEIMKEINNEHEIACKRFSGVHSESKGFDGKEYDKREYDTYNEAETPEMFRNIISSLISCEGMQIDIVGNWIWLTGNTYPYKDIIKGLGFRWASKKKAWYWNNGECAGTRSRMTLEEIKNKYGCQSVRGKTQLRIATA